MGDKKRCFVVMGFGVKTDFATGRKLDLDKSYKLLIKPVVVDKNLECIRADEIRHSGSIDVPMYQELLNADVVVADLSTANLNAFYELGIRHALRPRTTIVISEKLLPYPFDLNHIKITSYTHLGDAIDYDEVMRFRAELGSTIEAVLKQNEPDSPIYTFLDLVPPSLEKKMKDSMAAAAKASPTAKDESKENPSLSIIVEEGEKALKAKDYHQALGLFESAFLIIKSNFEDQANLNTTNHAYIIHRLAYATYKTKLPDEISALQKAIDLLSLLDLDHTNDPETVILGGKVEKKLFFNGMGDEHLNKAILYYERGSFLLHNRYNGINLAFLLNLRASTMLDPNDEEKITDMVWANRIRREILEMCEKHWKTIDERTEKMRDEKVDELSSNQKVADNTEKFWILANRAEAYFGLGEMENFRQAKAEAAALQHEDWMIQALENQLKRLADALHKTGHLLQRPWKE